MGGGYLYKQLTKDVREINKVFLSLFCMGIIVIAIYTSINITKSSYAIFSASIKGEKTIEVVVDNFLNKTTVFNYTGDSQEYEVPKDGYYYIEMAGASGGYVNSNFYSGSYVGLGAKTSGYIYLEKGEVLYFYVGQKGTDANTNCRSTGYEFNGGGIALSGQTGACGGTGGGATDVRLVGGNWDNTSSLISRIMVAGAGGGPIGSSRYSYPNGGTLYGTETVYADYQVNQGNPGTQIAGGAAPTKYASAKSNGTAGSFGKGGYGGANGNMASTDKGGGGGGGSGYYGGSGASGLSNGNWAGGGGSSYISGYAGVNSVEESTTITHTNQTLHYSGKYFIGGKMVEGQNEGNGYAKITYVREKPEKKITTLNGVRYIKNCINGNSRNSSNHWVELQAIKDGVNIAKGKNVTGTVSQNSSYPYSRITDGDIYVYTYAQASTTGTECITVDLGDTYDLDEIAVWNYFGDQRSYYDNITSVSSDNNSWTEVIDEAGIETSNGHRINAYTDAYNGYVQDNLVLWYDGYANTGTTKNYTSTTWKDLSGTGYNGTVSGATWYDEYLSFDGVNDWVKIGELNYPNNTIEIVSFKDNVTDNDEYLIGNEQNGGNGLIYRNNTILADYYINDSYKNISTSYELNKININSVSYDGKVLKLYKNGKIVSKLENAGSIKYPTGGTPIVLGVNPFDSSYDANTFFKGRIYSVRIYNRALTEEELLHNYLYDIEKFNLD